MRDSPTSFSKFDRRWFGLTALALAVVASIRPSGIALAHAALVRSEPMDGTALNHSPARITAWFEQELEETGSTIAVFDANGRQVDDGIGGVDLNDPDHASMTARVTAVLATGRYAVRWVAMSATDGHAGHPSRGEFDFEIR